MSRKSLPSQVLASLLRRLITGLRVLKYSLLSSNSIDGELLRFQPTLALGLGAIKVGANVRIGYYPSPHFYSTYGHLETRAAEARISIGDNTQINNGFVAIAERSSIAIGANCLIGTRVEIYDSDFHSLTEPERESGKPHLCRPVVIEDDVFIGSNVRILKGVTIGRGAVIGNQSVVTRDVPPYCVASGSPAVLRRRLD